MSPKVIFITGTDTGVGKTVLTALLLRHLRSHGLRAVALKPFCSGSRADAELLHQLQDGDLSLNEINPVYFSEPVAPLVSSRKHRRRISLEKVVQHIEAIAARVGQIPARFSRSSEIQNSKSGIDNFLLIEGSGGLLVPLGEGYTVRDLIARLACDVIVVSRNKLGTINHTLLTLQALAAIIPRSALRAPDPKRSTLNTMKVALMDSDSRDASTHSNPEILAELVVPNPLVRLPFLGPRCSSVSVLKENAKKMRKTLARLLP